MLTTLAARLWWYDRGLGGAKVYVDFIKAGVHFIHRVKTSWDTRDPQTFGNYCRRTNLESI